MSSLLFSGPIWSLLTLCRSKTLLLVGYRFPLQPCLNHPGRFCHCQMEGLRFPNHGTADSIAWMHEIHWNCALTCTHLCQQPRGRRPGEGEWELAHSTVQE